MLWLNLSSGLTKEEHCKHEMAKLKDEALDILGLLLTVVVHSAGIAERAGAKLVLAKLMSYFTSIKIIWADGGYSGKAF